MSKALTAVILLIGIIIIILFLPSGMTSLFDFRTNEQSDAYAVTTGAGQDNYTVTLTQALWEDETRYVESISSDLGTDNPRADSYMASTKGLKVTGLTADASRNLTVVYDISALEEYQGVKTVSGISPLLIWVVIIAIAIGGIVAAFRYR